MVDCRNPEVNILSSVSLPWSLDEIVVSQQLKLGSTDSFLFFLLFMQSNIKSWKFNSEVERVLWNHFSPFNFLVSYEPSITDLLFALIFDGIVIL